MKPSINKILVPTDFSEVAECALKAGVAIAGRQNAGMILLHSIDNYSYLQPSEVFLHQPRVMKDVRSQIEIMLNELAEKIKAETGVEAEVIVSEGSPAETICRVAIEEKVSLIVMGTHGISGMRKFFIGSESYRVIKNTLLPVLTIPGNWLSTEFKKIIFPVRLKSGALDKYYYARPIIEKNNSEVMLLGLADEDDPEALQEVTFLMDRLKDQLFTDDVRFYTALTRSSDFSRTIIDLAEEFGADLIILSSDIDHNIRSFFIGPFFRQVICHSHLPVLSIKPMESADSDIIPPDIAGQAGKSDALGV